MKATRSRPDPAGTAQARVWRAPGWARALATSLALCNLVELTAWFRSAAAGGAGRGLGAACHVAVFTYLATISVLYAIRCKVILTRETVIIVNVLRSHTVSVAEISGVLGMVAGLAILRDGRRGFVLIEAAPLSRWALDLPFSRCGEIAHAVLAAARRSAAD